MFLFLPGKADPPRTICNLVVEMKIIHLCETIKEVSANKNIDQCFQTSFHQSMFFFLACYYPYSLKLLGHPISPPPHRDIPSLLQSPSNFFPVATGLTFCPACVQSKCQFGGPKGNTLKCSWHLQNCFSLCGFFHTSHSVFIQKG